MVVLYTFVVDPVPAEFWVVTLLSMLRIWKVMFFAQRRATRSSSSYWLQRSHDLGQANVTAAPYMGLEHIMVELGQS